MVKLNVKQLEKNMIIPNYKKLCEVLELNITTGTSKIAQLKEMERYFKYHKSGNKFIIDEIYEEVLEKTDGRKNNTGGANNRKEFPNFLISKEDETKIGIYKIVLNNNIYIGSTIASFRRRFLQHNNEKFNKVPFTSDMLREGATFEIIELCDGLTEMQIRTKENQYIKQYREDKDWNIINSRDAWEYAKKQKFKTIKIQVKEEDYKNVLMFLQSNNLV
jgi:hypothetical protein